METSDITKAIMEIKSDLSCIKTDLEWIKKNATTENLAIKEVSDRVELLETWKDETCGAWKFAVVLGGFGGVGFIIQIIRIIMGN